MIIGVVMIDECFLTIMVIVLMNKKSRLPKKHHIMNGLKNSMMKLQKHLQRMMLMNLNDQTKKQACENESPN